MVENLGFSDTSCKALHTLHISYLSPSGHTGLLSFLSRCSLKRLTLRGFHMGATDLESGSVSPITDFISQLATFPVSCGGHGFGSDPLAFESLRSGYFSFVGNSRWSLDQSLDVLQAIASSPLAEMLNTITHVSVSGWELSTLHAILALFPCISHVTITAQNGYDDIDQLLVYLFQHNTKLSSISITLKGGDGQWRIPASIIHLLSLPQSSNRKRKLTFFLQNEEDLNLTLNQEAVLQTVTAQWDYMANQLPGPRVAELITDWI